MDILMYLINNVFNQAVFVIGMVVFLGMLVQKTEMSKIIASTVKTMIGFLLINTGGQTLGAALLPLQPMLIKVFRLQVKVQDLGAAQAESLGDIGSEMALIFALGFLMNILLARITKFKYVHLSAHVIFLFRTDCGGIKIWDKFKFYTVSSVRRRSVRELYDLYMCLCGTSDEKY